jgi:hypothetical protein
MSNNMKSFADPMPALVASLFEDPFYQAISIDFADDEAKRRQILSRYFELSLEEAFRTGRCCMLADRSLGASAWLLPRDAATELAESRAKTAALGSLLGPIGWSHYRRIIDFMTLRSRDLHAAQSRLLRTSGFRAGGGVFRANDSGNLCADAP